ncbi:MAG: 3-deoxy-7-phosphoheptulonate synthase [Peptococcaceae bacterium]|nr:3-deoxy-7-phosphoheptulonate synthase [Peptococcaceae bacterium]
MIIKLRSNAEQAQVEQLINWLEGQGIQLYFSEGDTYSIIGLVGDTSRVDIELIEALEIVESVTRIQEPFKNANRKFHPDDTVIHVGDATIGGGTLTLIAGPCSVENEAQITEVAQRVKAAGATILRGGAFKPRTSPYSFQGMGAEGIDLLLKAKAATGLPIISEVMDISQLPLFADVDILQIGARNMQNFNLLKEVGKMDKPVLLKRGLCATYEEWLMSAEYIMAGGNKNVILCERGIRTFETKTRNTLDISAVPMLRELTHLPIVIDPSHAAGIRRMVRPLSMAAVAAGADGLMIEVHNDPERAKCDGPQCLRPDTFDEVAADALKLHDFCKKELHQ